MSGAEQRGGFNVVESSIDVGLTIPEYRRARRAGAAGASLVSRVARALSGWLR